ncbi:MAG: hypothetical protein DI626_09545 [Micavibrio aeruginosavorus]|uniref:Uncharacterized protein n=1 Tax=Micavibrio aeruginosavorus TaxID=349221 RepID=A0A2W4ZMV6_9BACT|nr:MAG: hypothetical protein DI626_09545 [Micavibrio aeruginosavorus]
MQLPVTMKLDLTEKFGGAASADMTQKTPPLYAVTQNGVTIGDDVPGGAIQKAAKFIEEGQPGRAWSLVQRYQ